jgi:hypothetical protein
MGGTTKFFWFYAGQDCTRWKPRMVLVRAKAGCDEAHIEKLIDHFGRIGTGSDMCVLLSGRNYHVYKDFLVYARKMKPSCAKKEIIVQYDEEQMSHLMVARERKSLDIDSQDPGLFLMKDKTVMKLKKAIPRRFVSGNSAFKVMSNCPVVQPGDLHKVSPTAADKCYRGATPSDKYHSEVVKKETKHGQKGADDAPEASSDSDSDHKSDDDVKVASATNVPLCPMELHGKV